MPDYRLSHCADGRGKLYDQRFSRNRTGFYWHNFELNLLRELFFDLSRNYKGPVLDFACGTGRITSLLNDYFSPVTGIDVSATMLEEARVRLPEVRFIQTDLTRNSADIGKFKLISAFRFFLNAQESLRQEVLLRLHSTLEPGGLLLVNNHLRQASVNGSILHILRKFGLTRRNYLSDSHIENLLESHGFCIVKSISFCRIPGFDRFPPVSSGLWCKMEKLLSGNLPIHSLCEQKIYLCQKQF